MKSYTVLGHYPANKAGDIGDYDPVCVSCYGEPADQDPNDAPIFADSEADSPTHCGMCGDLIPHSLTGDGERYVYDALTALSGGGNAEVLASWTEVYGYVLPQCLDCGAHSRLLIRGRCIDCDDREAQS